MSSDHTNLKMPTFFIVGAAKCGTTALYTYLSEHPQIFMSRPKEPGFFAKDFLGERRPVRDLAEYLRCFSGASEEKMIGEASTAYFLSKAAPEEIKTFAPNAFIIIMLRNPVDKLYSRFMEARLSNKEHHKTLEDALESERRCGPSFGLGYIESGRYSTRVHKYFETFGRDRVHVIIYDDFKNHTATTYQNTLRFLGVNNDERTNFPPVNRSGFLRSMVLQEWLKHPPEFLRRLARTTTTLRMRKTIGGCISQLNLISPPPMAPELKERLRREFETEVEVLGQLIGRNLSNWSEGSVDVGVRNRGTAY